MVKTGDGVFITVEGTDGSGKSTQIRLMADYLKGLGREVVLTREPGGTAIGEKIRAIILDPGNDEMGKMTEMLLYASARAQIVEELIKPSLQMGRIVICDRFIDSTYVYQGFGRGIDMKVIDSINNAAMNGIFRQVTFFFDINPEAALKRRYDASEADRIEKEDINFHIKVYEGYRRLAQMHPDRIKCIDAGRGIKEIFEDVRTHLDRLVVPLRV